MSKEAPSWDDVEVGDTVVLEPVTRKITGFGQVGDLRYAIYDGLPHDGDGYSAGLLVNDALNPIKSVEKPVRTFSVGDKVRGLDDNNGFFATIVPGGYVLHRNAKYVQTPITFDSLNYELLD